MRYKTILKDFFSFNRKELSGILVLITLIFLVFSAGRLMPVYTANRRFDTTGFDRDARALRVLLHHRDSLDSVFAKKRVSGWSSRNGNGFSTGWDSSGKNGFPAKKQPMVELNSADSFELQQLRGIGPGYARRILRYRERLGGFVSKQQVMEVYGMDTARFRGIEASIWVRGDTVRRINLNTVEFKALLAHPYFPFEVTRSIMLYRKEKKKIRTMEEVAGIKGMTDSLFRKMQPYIRVE